jgi:hypothetical protein
LGLQLRVTAYRQSDKRTASNSFEFRYLEHNVDGDYPCPHCGLLSAHTEVTQIQATRIVFSGL